MGVTSKAILFGDVTAAEIAAVLEAAFPTIDKVDTLHDKGDSHFVLIFPEPNLEYRGNGNATHRQLFVFPPESIGDDADVYDGKRTIISFSGWGSDQEMLEILAKEFGGFVSLRDSSEWATYEPSTDIMTTLSPECRLKVKLSQTLPLEQATLLAKLVDTPELIEQVAQHFADYTEAKNVAAATPAP
ncbi:hypothetical protein [Mesorhizobium sp. SP-1A]|uniref:hypothetical protein n=1 Tax=Mesorhizobium sp. SP-1A TaxID=3077840 RepID=UPI0028F7117B|nr:hypothetical protein [Mesorhizobium sp. SP-1A]